MRRRGFLARWLVLTVLALPLSFGAATAQESSQTRLLVGYSTGSVTALVAELVHPVLEEVLDNWVVVQAVPGDRGIEAAQAVHEAEPDPKAKPKVFPGGWGTYVGSESAIFTAQELVPPSGLLPGAIGFF